MKQNNKENRNQLKTPTKFWQIPKKLISTKNSLGKFFVHAKTSSNKYKAKFTKLEQQYNNSMEQFANKKPNSILSRLLRRNWTLANKVNSSSNKSNRYLLLKCLLAGSVVYGSIYTGIWGNQNDSDKIIEQVVNREINITTTDLITAYNDAVKFVGEQVQKFPENSGYYYSETRKKISDVYETIKRKFRSE